jgi:protein-tyrosine phosphatase
MSCPLFDIVQWSFETKDSLEKIGQQYSTLSLPCQRQLNCVLTDIQARLKLIDLRAKTEEVVSGDCDWNEILPGKLYLGDISTAQSLKCLSSLNITHVLSIIDQKVILPKERIQHKTIEAYDMKYFNFRPHFTTIYHWIKNAFNQHNNAAVLVHCAYGRSRSTTAVISFLMREFCWSYSQAYSFVLVRRSCIKPNDGFVEQLQVYEKQLTKQLEQRNQQKRRRLLHSIFYRLWRRSRFNIISHILSILDSYSFNC